MAKQSINRIIVEGILVENNLEARVSKAEENYISGDIVIRVGEGEDAQDIPIEYYSKEFKKGTTTVSKIYTSLQKLMQMPSVADDGVGTKIIVSGGEIALNDFYTDDMQLISYPRLKSNFYKKSGKNYKPQSVFEFEGVVRNFYREIKNDAETGRLILEVVGIDYFGSAVPVKFIVEKEAAINYIQAYYASGRTVKVRGDIIYKAEKVTKVIESAFGDDIEKEYDKVTKEFIVTSGTEPYEPNDAYKEEEIKEAMQNRNIYLEAKKAEKLSKDNEQPQAPKANTATTTNAKPNKGGFPF